MAQVEGVELEELVALDPAGLEVGFHVRFGVDTAQPDVGEVAVEHVAELGPVEEVEVERVLEVGGPVRRDQAHHAVVLDDPGELGHVGLGVGEVLDQVRGAGAVEAGRAEAEGQGVHLGHAQTLGAVAGGGGGRRVGGVVHADDLAGGVEEAGGLEALATAHIEDAPVADAVEHGPVAGLVQGEQGIRRHSLLGPLPREAALCAGGHGGAPFA